MASLTLGAISFDMSTITPNLGGIDAVLSVDSVRAMLSQYVGDVAATATANAQVRGAEYRAYVDMASYVPIGKVTCGNYKARIDNAHHNTILKSR